MLQVQMKSETRGMQIYASGSACEIADDLLNVVSALHAQLQQMNVADAIIFRTCVLTALNDPHAGVWDETQPAGTIAMGFMRKDTGKAEKG